jgi:hypothetical protein
LTVFSAHDKINCHKSDALRWSGAWMVHYSAYELNKKNESYEGLPVPEGASRFIAFLFFCAVECRRGRNSYAANGQ